MIILLLSLAISFAITYFTIPVIIFLSRYFNIYDQPDKRKVHARPVSALGGLGIFAGLVFTTLVFVPFRTAPEFQYFIAAALLIFFLGLKDDLLAISPYKKFAGQSIAAFLVIYMGNIHINDMHGFAGIHYLPPMLTYLVSYFTVIVIINSINLIDGVDGLAGSLVLLASAFLGFYFLRYDYQPYALLSFALTGSLSAFLLFNFQPAKIFMGDTGSLVIGLVCSILLLKFIELSASDAAFPVTSGAAIGFSILLIPLADTLRVFGWRILHKRSPFRPDRNHIHHLLLERGWSHQQVTILLVSVNAGFIICSYMGRQLGNTILLFLLIGAYFAGLAILTRLVPVSHSSLKQAGDNIIRPLQPSTPKVVPLNKEMFEEEEIYGLQKIE